VIELRLTLPEGVVEEIARRAAEIVLDRLAEERPSGGDSPYLTVAEAATYLRASRQRVYDLLSSGRLSRRKDGSRVLVSRSELDAYLAGGNGRRGRR
jgi:excisionase family DNA binding protein